MFYGATERKALGAYYTGSDVARFLARWAIRPGDRVLDPSCGDGVFLEHALACAPEAVIGVEISELQARETAEHFRGNDRVGIVTSDFFNYNSEHQFDAVIGNPPYIRYQNFSGAMRERALFRCARAGVPMNKLASSWAPFVVVAGEQLREGGRMGLVLPAELLHAKYAQSVLRYLRATFGTVTIVTFKERLFPDLSQDTLLVLAAEKGRECSALVHIDALSIAEVDGSAEFDVMGRSVDVGDYLSGNRRMKEALIDPVAVEILRNVLESGVARRLGDVASINIGYVTGANAFFHVSAREARIRGVAPRFLSPTVYRGASLSGISYRVDDWRAGNETDDAGYLVRVLPGQRLTDNLRAYIFRGERLGYSKRFKCRIRSPWYIVPPVNEPDGFLTSMSGFRPSIVVNEANVLAANSLHIVRCKATLPISVLAVSWLSSVSGLSIEVEGHALGGGMLKLEPTEAERVVLADIGRVSKRQLRMLDKMVRDGEVSAASAHVDQLVAEHTGLTTRQLRIVRSAAKALRLRRAKPRA